MSNVIDSIQLSGTVYTIGSGGGITSGEVQTMIDENISGKTDTTAFTAHTSDSAIHVTSSDKSTWSAKQDALVSGENIKTINNESILGSGNITIQSGGGSPTVELTQAEYDALVTAGTVSANTYYIITDAQAGDLTQYWTSAQTQSAITQATSGKLDTSTFETYSGSVETALSGKQDTLSAGTNITIVDNVISATGGGGSSYTAGDGINITNDVISVTGKVDTSAITTSITSSSTDSQVPSAKCVYDQFGGLKLLQITQSDYDNLTTKDPNTLYVIVN